MFGRRVPPNVVFLLSSLLCIVCAFIAYRAFSIQSTITGVIAAIFAIWFAIDAFRSYGWTKRKP